MLNKVIVIIKRVSDKMYKRLLMFAFALTAIVWGAGPILKKLEFLGIIKVYNSILNFFPDIEQQIVNYRIIITIINATLILAYFIKQFYKEKALIIKQSSMSSNTSEIDKRLSDKYKLIPCTIDQYGISIEEAIVKQDTQLRYALQKTYKQYFYYGIATTPYIFRLGFQFGDERNIRLLHKKRDNNSFFTEISKDEDIYLELNIVEALLDNSSNDLLVSLGTSFPIAHHDLQCFNPDSMHRLYFYIDFMNVDSLLAYDRMKRYREKIMFNIRKVVKDCRIKTIHIAAATSVGFTFYWAQSFSRTHDPEIIVYHYENGTYPWGISIKADPPNCIIKNTASILDTSQFV